METGGHLRGRANFTLIFPAILPIQKYETPYNTTDCNICQDLFCEKNSQVSPEFWVRVEKRVSG